MTIARFLLPIFVAVVACACQSLPSRSGPSPADSGGQRPWFDGNYDNHEQVVLAGTAKVPRTRIGITPLTKPGWYAWTVGMSADAEFSATWAMRSVKSVNGNIELTPYRALVEAPKLGAEFDPAQWVALDACALNGAATAAGLKVKADLASCLILIPGIGANAALLPLEIEHDGEWLRVRFYADQARGQEARIEARRLRWFTGWAAVNGAGANARIESNDWHMNRGIRIDNEGGRAPLTWRDGKASGYSLSLERMTYRDGSVPVLKLSVIEDASGSSVVYAWANPEATRIGINLGWVQVGLEAESNAPAR
jgi:hypothetical protein